MREEQIARDLLKIRAVFFRPDEPFTWASGIKSPVYCDNRLTLSDPAVRADVENGLYKIKKTLLRSTSAIKASDIESFSDKDIRGFRSE